MMIFLGFPLVLFISLKSFLFINSLFLFGELFFILICMSFLIVFFFYMFNFFYLNNLNHHIYYAFFFLMFIFMNMCFVSDSMIFFIFFFEFSVFPMIFIILNFSFGMDKIISSIFMMVMNLFGSLPFIFSMSLVLNLMGSMNISFIFFYSYLMINSIYFMIFLNLVFLFKLPLFMFHFWLPKAHVSASASCSIVLASLMLKLGSLGLFKFSSFFNFMYDKTLLFFGSILFFSFLIFSLSILRNMDFKNIIAMSSIIHMTPIPFMLFSFNLNSIYGSFLLMVGHGFVSSMLFYLVSIFYEQSFNRSIFFIKGIYKISKMFCYIILITFLLNFGFPPFITFMSELILSFCCFFFSYYLLISFSFYMIFCNLIFISLCTKMILYNFNHYLSFDANLMMIYISFSSILGLILVLFF